MKKLNKIIAKSLSVIITLFLLISFNTQVKATENNNLLLAYKGKTISFLTSTSYKPFQFLNEDGVYVGFDIDLMNEICKLMQIKCTLDNVDFNGLIIAIVLKKYDVGISAISIKKEREKVVTFTTPYLNDSGAVFVTTKNNNFNINDPKMVVGVEAGSVQANYLKKINKYQIKYYPNVVTAMLDLQANKINAIINSTETLKPILKSNPNLKVASDIIKDPVLGRGMGLIVNKDNDKLAKSISAAIEILKKNGFIDKLQKKWDVE